MSTKSCVVCGWKTLTKAQHRALQVAAKDGSIIFGGIDQTKHVRRDVVMKLAEIGLLVWQAPSSLLEESEWVLTPTGRAYLSKQD